MSTLAESMALEAEGMTEHTAGTRVHAGGKGICSSPSTPREYIDSSAVSKSTATYVVWDK